MGLFDWLSRGTPRDLPPLRLHNTLGNKTEVFVPLSARSVKMYNCGPTPYDRQHIGNMVPPVFADILRNTLQAWGYKVKQVMNITDFGHLTGDNEGDPNRGDDKMTRGLAREGLQPTMENMRALAEKYAGLFLEDVALLGVNTARVSYPRASDYIPEQIALIRSLEQKSYAYQISDGVYYDTSKFQDYGKLGHINLQGQQEGARVEGNKEKKNPHDFVLWKKSAEAGWQSPWGLGFPGWHIECTAMLFKLLGKQIDIHTGGIEHIPIHHNNEIAQAQAITGKQYVRYWLHTAHITLEGRKISKSLGNTVYLHSLADRGLSPKAFRYWYLTGHYRTAQNFTWEAIEGANTALMRLRRAFIELPEGGIPHEPFMKAFYAAIADDLDTPKALALVWDLLKDESVGKEAKRASLVQADTIFGLGLANKQDGRRLGVVPGKDLPSSIAELLARREAAREAKDFAKADELRAELSAAGYEVKDTPQGPQLTQK